MSEETPDKLLIDRIQHGSGDQRIGAEGVLYGRYKDLVHGYVIGNADPSLVDDLEQTIWKEIVRSARKVTLRYDTAKAWVMGITRNQVAEYYRSRKTAEELPEELPEEGIGSDFRITEALEKRAAILELRTAWRALTPEQRLVIFLADIVQTPVSEVIRWVGHSQQSIYEMHRRARQALATSVQQIELGTEPQSEWLEPYSHTNMVIELYPALSAQEASLLADATHVKPDELSEHFEFGMTLFIGTGDAYLETVDQPLKLFHLALLSREGLEEYLAGVGEGCVTYLFEMTLQGDRLTIAPHSEPVKTRTGWRDPPNGSDE